MLALSPKAPMSIHLLMDLESSGGLYGKNNVSFKADSRITLCKATRLSAQTRGFPSLFLNKFGFDVFFLVPA